MLSSALRTVVAAGLVLAAVVWVLVNGQVEGRVLVVFTPDHGLTEADLLSVAAVAVAAILLLSPRRSSPAGRPGGVRDDS